MGIDSLRGTWLGIWTLIFSTLPSALFLLTGSNAYDVSYSPVHKVVDPLPQCNVNLGLAQDFSALCIGDAREQMSFSVDPPRPDAALNRSELMIRLIQSKQIKRVEVPVRVDLAFSDGILQFAHQASAFWVTCASHSEGEIVVTLFYKTLAGEEVEHDHWIASSQETPIQAAEEFPPASPFRILGEARWLGQDLFLEKYAAAEVLYRLEIGPPSQGECIDCSLKDWLAFKEGSWRKVNSLEEMRELPIAHCKSISSQGLEIEGWDGSAHIRIKLPPASLPPLKMRGEELFTQLRVRSEKQVSCILDKQCLVLRPNDWALKTQGRWKILRKKEERDAFLERKLVGELFVLDRIEMKGATKSIAGHYFAAGRAQMVPIEYIQKPLMQKGSERK